MNRAAAHRLLWMLVIVGTVAAAVAGCRGRERAAPTGAAAATVPTVSPDGGELHVYIWSAYLPDAVVEEFRRRTGIEVTVDVYDTNEALLAKLQSGVADYDLVVPSDYMMRILAHEKLLQPLDKSRIATLSNLDPR
ncbi:MAG TPA: hypothetical protein VN923_06175, partial [Thermoanaerobaculia bacterium]|nr:hypothetical protein [Thermoanaerobaculia bacterium]